MLTRSKGIQEVIKILRHEDCSFLIFQATYEKGTKQDIEEFIYQILDVSDDGTVGR